MKAQISTSWIQLTLFFDFQQATVSVSYIIDGDADLPTGTWKNKYGWPICVPQTATRRGRVLQRVIAGLMSSPLNLKYRRIRKATRYLR